MPMTWTRPIAKSPRLNESPSEKEGKSGVGRSRVHIAYCLNESPSEKEGK